MPMASCCPRLRCLVVDDSAHFVAAATEILERQGITVVGSASDVAGALRRIRQLRPDVVLVDIHLREESGFELAEKLRGGESAVILTSTYDEHEFSDLVSASPALGFLPKFALSSNAVRNLLSSSMSG